MRILRERERSIDADTDVDTVDVDIYRSSHTTASGGDPGVPRCLRGGDASKALPSCSECRGLIVQARAHQARKQRSAGLPACLLACLLACLRVSRRDPARVLGTRIHSVTGTHAAQRWTYDVLLRHAQDGPPSFARANSNNSENSNNSSSSSNNNNNNSNSSSNNNSNKKVQSPASSDLAGNEGRWSAGNVGGMPWRCRARSQRVIQEG